MIITIIAKGFILISSRDGEKSLLLCSQIMTIVTAITITKTITITIIINLFRHVLEYFSQQLMLDFKLIIIVMMVRR